MNGTARYYIGMVALGGLIGLAYGFSSFPQPDDLGVLVLLVVLCGLAQAASVPLFSGSSVSLAFAVSFIALLLFGPAGGILANLGSAAMHAVYPRRRVWYKVVFNTGVFTISAAAAGATFAAAGGAWPVHNLTSSAIPAGLAALVYFVINTTTVSLAVSLTTGTDFRTIFNESHRWLVLHYLTIAAISLMAALGYESMGWPGLLAFSLPLLMPWASTRMYVAQTKRVIARNADLTQVNAKLEDVNVSLQRRIEEMDAFHRIGLALNRAVEFHEMLAYIVDSVRELTRAHGVAIFVYDKEHGALGLGAQVGLSDDYMQLIELSLNGPAMRALREGRRIVVSGESVNHELLSAAAAREGIIAAACLPLTVGEEVVGALDITFRQPHVFSDNELTVLEVFAEQAAAGIHSAQLYQQVHSSYLSTIAALIATVEAKDPYTRGHSESVRDLAISTGTTMGLPPNELETLELAALFHDIGKIGIPENILGKAGALTEAEWQLVKRHPLLAENILKHLPTLAETIPVIRSHHERLDGRGYPDGLRGDIPKLSAIISVADAYDAMTSNRPYRNAMSKVDAIAQLKGGDGTQFEGTVLAAFLRVVEPDTGGQPELSIPEIQFRRASFCPAVRAWESRTGREAP